MRPVNYEILEFYDHHDILLTSKVIAVKHDLMVKVKLSTMLNRDKNILSELTIKYDDRRDITPTSMTATIRYARLEHTIPSNRPRNRRPAHVILGDTACVLLEKTTVFYALDKTGGAPP